MTRRRLLALGVALAVPALVVTAAPPAAAPAKARQPMLNAYLAPGFSDAAWQKAAFDKVLKNWKPGALPPAGKKTVIISNVARDGAIVGAREHMASGVPAWDKAAAEAVTKATPFPPLPKSWPHATLEIHWHFETR